MKNIWLVSKLNKKTPRTICISIHLVKDEELDMFILKEIILRGDVTAICKYLKCCHKGNGGQQFIEISEKNRSIKKNIKIASSSPV